MHKIALHTEPTKLQREKKSQNKKALIKVKKSSTVHHHHHHHHHLALSSFWVGPLDDTKRLHIAYDYKCFAGQPTLVYPRVWVHRKTSFVCSFLISKQLQACFSIIFGWFLTWEVNGLTTIALCVAATTICWKQFPVSSVVLIQFFFRRSSANIQ